jgi:hypothetical protein
MNKGKKTPPHTRPPGRDPARRAFWGDRAPLFLSVTAVGLGALSRNEYAVDHLEAALATYPATLSLPSLCSIFGASLAEAQQTLDHTYLYLHEALASGNFTEASQFLPDRLRHAQFRPDSLRHGSIPGPEVAAEVATEVAGGGAPQAPAKATDAAASSPEPSPWGGAGFGWGLAVGIGVGLALAVSAGQAYPALLALTL